MTTKTLTALLITAALSAAHAQTLSGGGIRIGVLTDLSGQGSVKAMTSGVGPSWSP